MDDDGVIHVFEALLTGVLILTAILFMTGLSAPSASESTGGIDLGRIATDTLDILQSRDAEDPVTYDNRLEEIVHEALAGDTAGGADFVEDILPTGTRYLLRLDNGYGTLTLLPAGTGPTVNPRAADAGQAYMAPLLDAFAGLGPDVTAAPTTALDFSTWTSLEAPDGGATAPDGGTWLAWWTAQVPTEDRVPAAVPFGTWRFDDGAVKYLEVPAPGGATRPLYAVQLLVWPGA